MLYWVALKDNIFEIFYGSQTDAYKLPNLLALYGPFTHRRFAKGCVCDLSSNDPAVFAIAQKSRVELANEPVASKAEEPKTETKATKKKGTA